MGIDRNNYQIGLYLDKALQYKKLTIKDLSKSSGIDASMLRKYISNESSPSLTTIKKIAKVLGMDIEYFTKDAYYKDVQVKTNINEEMYARIDEANDQNIRLSYKSINRMINQIFSSVSLEGKRKIIHTLHFFLVTYIREIAYSDNKSKDSWKLLYYDSSLLHDMFGINEKDYIKLRTSFNKQLNDNIKKHNAEQY